MVAEQLTMEFYDISEVYFPKEYAKIDEERSWKKCRCGRITHIRDRYCPACGQKLGIPKIEN